LHELSDTKEKKIPEYVEVPSATFSKIITFVLPYGTTKVYSILFTRPYLILWRC